MRRLVVVVLAVALALTLTACGGGEEEPAEETTEEVAPAAAPAAVEATEPDLSPTEEQVYEPFPTDTEVVPEAILVRIEDRQAMMLYIFDDDQSTTGQQTEWVNEVAKSYPGLVDVLSYDIGKYVETDTNGVITSNSEALTEAEDQSSEYEDAQKVARLLASDYLDVGFTPYIIIIDEDGYMTYRVRGPIDADMLEGQILRATD